MKRVAGLCGIIVALLVVAAARCWAQVPYDTQDEEGGRYKLVMFKGTSGSYGRSYLASKTPAMVLDTYQGIVWRCLNIQDERPMWIKNDLAKNAGQAPMEKRYTIKILEWPSTEVKLPAIVLDTREGKTWTCSNIFDESARWASKDLIKDIKDEGYKYP